MSEYTMADRDLSWLAFNERLLDEAARQQVPLAERIKFLSIYSSNLDEFYRVRMPALLALQKIKKDDDIVYRQASSIINTQLARFGDILVNQLKPALQQYGYKLISGEPIPDVLHPQCAHFFFTQIAAFLQPVLLTAKSDFFPENNELYLAVIVRNIQGDEPLYLLKVPCTALPRFFTVKDHETTYILYQEDVIRLQLAVLFPGQDILGSYNIKITRDAELSLEEDYGEDLADKIEKQLIKRDKGFATRFLYEPGFPLRHLRFLVDAFNLGRASVVEGGRHHNLKDLISLPVAGEGLRYPDWPAVQAFDHSNHSLFDFITARDLMVHAPYHSYDTILRFFNEAAIDTSVEEISTTLYRVASDSRIGQALISAARNGKKVYVLVELKARFDEANNILWSKRLKAAGVRITYSSTALKVHAKIALVKRRHPTTPYLGLLATGNLNESTARFYTDHILLTANQSMLQEMEQLFNTLRKKKSDDKSTASFNILLVAQFNLHTKFVQLIDQEIQHARNGKRAFMIIKLNNLEEPGMIEKLYEASNAGVQIDLIVRGICRLLPGVEGQSTNIRVRRIVDRYLEHGRIFLFHNNGDQLLFLGSSDWMTRNIFHRIEVCFPVVDPEIKAEVVELLNIQLNDNVQAVRITKEMNNEPVATTGEPIRSQEKIYQYLLSRK